MTGLIHRGPQEPAYRSRLDSALGLTLVDAGLLDPSGLLPNAQHHLRGLVDDLCARLDHVQVASVFALHPDRVIQAGVRAVVERTTKDDLLRRLANQRLLPLDEPEIRWVDPSEPDPAELRSLHPDPVNPFGVIGTFESWHCWASVWAAPLPH